MTMDLPSALPQFTSGAAIHDPVTPGLQAMATQQQDIAGLGGIPGLESAASALQSMVSAVTEKWQAVLSQLPVALPAMKQVLILEKKLDMAANGGIASAAGSAGFESYFGAVDSVKAQVSSVTNAVNASMSALAAKAAAIPGVAGTGGAALRSLAGVVPPAKIPDPNNPGQTITNPAYTAFMSNNSANLQAMTGTAGDMSGTIAQASSSVQAQFSAADGAYKAGMDQLKGMAFASFCAAPQPAAVRNVLDKVIKPGSIPSQDAVDKFNTPGAAWVGVQTGQARGAPVVASDNPDMVGAKPTIDATQPTGGRATSAQIDAIEAQLRAQLDTQKQLSSEVDAAATRFASWKRSVNYDAVKNNKDADPQAYETLRAQAVANADYIEMTAKNKAYAEAGKRYNKLYAIRSYMLTQGPYPGNPDGPW